MSIAAFRKISTPNEELDRVQDNVELFANQLTIPILSGTLLKDISLSSSETQVSHKLSRAYQGFIITKINANENVWVSSETRANSFINLTASGAVTIDLWVF